MSDTGRVDSSAASRPAVPVTMNVRHPDGHPRLAAVPTAAIAAATIVLYVAAARVGAVWSDDVIGPVPLALTAGVATGVMFITRQRSWPATLAATAVISVVHDTIFIHPTIGEHAVLVVARLLAAATVGVSLAWAFGSSRLGIDVRSVVGVVIPPFGLMLPALLVAIGIDVVGMSRREVWVTWMVGESVGMIVVTMLLTVPLVPFSGESVRHVRGHKIEAALTMAGTVALAAASYATTVPLPVLLIPALAWLSLRLSNIVAPIVLTALVIYGTIRTDAGHGPFASFERGVLWLQLLHVATAFIVLVVGRTHWQMRYVDRRYRAILGVLPDEITIRDTRGRLIEDLTRPEQATTADVDLEGEWPSMIEAGLPARKLVNSNGDGRDFEVRLVPLGASLVMTVVRDVTNEREFLRELERANEHWKRLASTAFEGFIEVGPDTKVSYVSDRWADMHGLEPDQIVGQPFRDLFRPDEWLQFRTYAHEVFEGAYVRFEYNHTRPDGERRWALTTADGSVDADGKFEGFVSFAADTTELHIEVTNREVAELRLATVERRERQRVASFLHDGPLQTMVALGYRLNAIKAGADPAALAADLERMALDAIADMREGLTELAPSELGDGDLGEALRTATARFGTPAGAEIVIDDRLAHDLDLESASTLFLIGREAIINAILHASADTIRVTVGPFGGGYRLDVADDGIGISGAATSGSGHLGMRSMVRRAQEAGGRCDVRPNEPTGTRIVVWIPDLSIPTTQAATTSPTTTPDSTSPDSTSITSAVADPADAALSKGTAAQ